MRNGEAFLAAKTRPVSLSPQRYFCSSSLPSPNVCLVIEHKVRLRLGPRISNNLNVMASSRCCTNIRAPVVFDTRWMPLPCSHCHSEQRQVWCYLSRRKFWEVNFTVSHDFILSILTISIVFMLEKYTRSQVIEHSLRIKVFVSRRSKIVDAILLSTIRLVDAKNNWAVSIFSRNVRCYSVSFHFSWKRT